MNAARPTTLCRRTRLVAVCASRLFVWVIVAGISSAAQLSVAQETEGQTRFLRTVRYLQDAAPELRGDFAAIALTKLADAYIAEAQLAREDARASGRDANLRGWSVMVDYYARQMPILLDDIELGLPVALTIGGEQSVAITVADKTVILSPPRLSQQSAFEQEILADFCTTHRCEQFSPGNGVHGSIPVATVQVRPDWAFSTQGQVCSYQGIKVRFESEKNLVNSRRICEQFLREVTTLTDEMAGQQRHGVAIEWDDLEIQATPLRPEHMVRLNAMGDSVLVPLPVLHSSPGLLEQVLPWIRARLSNQQAVNIELDADLYGWQKP